MKKLSLLAAGLCSLGILAACGDDSSSTPKVSKGTECAEGLSTECIVGSWSYLGLENASGSKLNGFDFSANPTTMEFQENGHFVLQAPPNTQLGKDAMMDTDGVVSGTWGVRDGKLYMRANSTSIPATSFELNPEITVVGDEVKLKLGYGQIIFMYSEGIELGTRSYYSETFTISAN